MSNSTRQGGGQDERLVVPLEASRRGAHRARTNPLVAALPLLVVVIVVAAVIGVAYALFLKPSGDTGATDPLASSSASSGSSATSAPSSTTQPSTTSSASSSTSSSTTSSPSASSSSAATVDKSITFSVANGSGKQGLAGRVTAALKRAGFSGASVDTNPWAGTPVGTTTVFYAKDSQKATAEAIAGAVANARATKSAGDAKGGIVVVAFNEPK